MSVTMRERTLTWTALTSSVKKHRHRRRSNFTSAFVSETEQHGTAWHSMEHGVTVLHMETYGNCLKDVMDWAPRAARAQRAIDAEKKRVLSD